MPSDGTEQRKLAAIMFTDMVGYSALSQRNEALALELLEEHRSVLRGLFPKYQGTEIKTTGDGFLVEFAGAVRGGNPKNVGGAKPGSTRRAPGAHPYRHPSRGP